MPQSLMKACSSASADSRDELLLLRDSDRRLLFEGLICETAGSGELGSLASVLSEVREPAVANMKITVDQNWPQCNQAVCLVHSAFLVFLDIQGQPTDDFERALTR
jgi:hypothetical protein